MKGKALLWKVPLAVTGIVLGLVVLLLTVVGCVLYVTPVRKAVLQKALPVMEEKTGLDIDLGDIYLSPFHHSPMLFYRAYKGEADLPVEVRIDSLFVGHRGHDTLVCVQTLRLNAIVQNSKLKIQTAADLLATPIEVDRLLLDETAFHSGALIKTAGVDVTVGHLDVSSPELSIAEGRYPLHGLHLNDVYCGIDLRPKKPDTTHKEKKPLLLSFELPDGELRNIHFRLTPLGLDIRTGSLSTQATVDVGANCYDTRRLEVGRFALDLRNLHIPVDTLYGVACADIQHHLITSKGLYARSDEIGAQADLTAAEMNLKTMQVKVTGDADFRGNKAQVRACYDIDDEAYDAHVAIAQVDLSPFLKDNTRVVIAGEVEAEGRGINPHKPLRSHIKINLDEAIYGPFDLSHTSFEGSTDSVTSLALAVPGLQADMASSMPLFPLIARIQPLVQTVSDSAVLRSLTSLFDLTVLDTIRRRIPPVQADISLQRGSPIQFLIDKTGMNFDELSLSLRSDSVQTSFVLPSTTIYFPDSLRLPATEASLDVTMTEGQTAASLLAAMCMTDGAMGVYDLCTDALLRMDATRIGRELHGDGQLTLDSLSYANTDLGNHTIDMRFSPSQTYGNALRADVGLDDIPLGIIDGFVSLPDIAVHGAIRATASVDGLPAKADVSAKVQPLGVSAEYKPYRIAVGLGETPIIMSHNHIDLNGLPVYGADSTFIALNGGLDLNNMQVDVTLTADSFAPVKLPKDGPFPVYGELATDIQGTITGPLDSIVADVDLTILPSTDITYPIDKKNLAQVKPHGTAKVRYCTADGALDLRGQINVDDGYIRYSPKAYPIMPFHVDSGSHIAFNGPVGKTLLNVSASQQVKADVQSEGEETRRVDFRTGVRVNGVVDSIGLHSIGFFLEAPEDETVTHELASLDEENREGLAATLLATGMYVGESNVAAQRSGYALSSIVNSRINAAMANSKMGKVVDIDLSSAQTEHSGGTTNDMNLSISKSFLKDKLRITLGSTFTDNPEINKASGLLNNLSAEYKLTKDGNIRFHLFSQRDYNNILEGELYKSGLGVRATKEWSKSSQVYGLTADAGVAYRSNNSIGPDVTLKSSMANLLGKGETLTIKANGAYYWALRNRHPGDPRKTDTYKLGLTAALIFPYLHWTGENNPNGDTRYLVGYQYENIAGGYGVHKLSGSFSYFIKSTPFITHAFTPFSLSVVMMKAESANLLDKAAEYPQLIRILAGNEFVPSIGYSFIYNDYRDKRPVNTMLELGVKESGNLINALYCAFGRKWDEQDKKLGSVTFNQFVKLTAELRNKFNFTDQVCIATRLFAGANIPLGNSANAPLSEAFYAGGPNSMRAASPYAYGPGNFYSDKYNQNFFHSGDVKLEANFELRFPIVWKLFGAAFLDAGNVWNWRNSADQFKEAGYPDYVEQLQLHDELYDGIINNPYFAKQIALGTGLGLRLDFEGLVVRFDLGVAIHAPFQTYHYDKEGAPDRSRPINTYFNIPSALDAFRFNFGIGYPF